MTSSREIGQEVEQRAAGRCEYCRMHQALQGATFHVEHVIPLTSSTSSRAVLVDRQSLTISLGPVRAAICISPIASRWKRQVFRERCHSSIHAPTNGTTTSPGKATTSPGSRQSVERRLTCFFSITNAESRFVKLKRCSISFPRPMSSHRHSRRCLTLSA
jgi:hypothetical protein